MSLFKSTKYRVLFVRTMNGTPQSVGRKTMRKTKQTIVFRKIPCILDWSCPLYRKDGMNIYLYDLDKGQMFSEAVGSGIDPKLIKAVFVDELAKQLTAQAAKKSMFDIAYIGMVVLVILGLFVGLFLGPFLPVGG